MCQWCFARSALLDDKDSKPANWFGDKNVAPLPDNVSVTEEPASDLYSRPNVTPAKAGAHDEVLRVPASK